MTEQKAHCENNLTRFQQASVKPEMTYKNALLRYVISKAIDDYY